MPLSNVEKQARWRERHLINGTKARVQFVFDAGTKAQLDRLARHRDCTPTELIEDWAASTERRVTAHLSGKALKRYYDGTE